MRKITKWVPFQHLLNYLPLMKELVKRDLKVKYRRSFLGYLWSLLNPLLMMFIMNIVFGTFFKTNIPNFPLYLICGNTLWTFFNESTNMAMYSVIQNSSLIRKVYIPKFIFPLSRVLSSFVTMSFSLVAILIVMLFTRAQFYWTILMFWLPLFLLYLFCCGIGMILSALSVYFRDITHLYGVLLVAWMYMTPVFYDISILPEKLATLIPLNPMYDYITFFRSLILYGSFPSVEISALCVLFSGISLAAGLLVFRKLQRNFILYI